MSRRPGFARAWTNRALLGLVAAMLLGCAGSYKISPDVPAMTERDALAFFAKMAAASKTTPWACDAGFGIRTNPISSLSLNGSTLAISTRYIHSALAVTSVDTVTGEVTRETNKVVQDESHTFDLRNLDGIRVYKGRTRCGDVGRSRWILLKDESGLQLIVAPHPQLFEQTLVALNVLSPNRKIKTGLGF